MFDVHVTKALRPIGVLLGGSGRARMLTLRAPQIAALMMKPLCLRSRRHSGLARTAPRETGRADQPLPQTHFSLGGSTRQG